VITNPTLLTQNDTDALNASTTAAALSPTQTFPSSITTNTTVTGNGGLNVIKINGDINLGSSNSLTLSGKASDVFVVNVTGTLKFTGSGGLLLNGGVTANHVLYNILGTNSISSGVNNQFYGTLLFPKASYALDGNFIGELIGGGSSIQLLSGAKVNAGSRINNTATVSDTNDSNAANNTSSATITLQPPSLVQ